MTQALSPQDEIERTSIAFKNGFKHPKEYKGSWRKFESNEDLGAVWLTVDGKGIWHIGVEDQRVASRLDGKQSTISGPGYSRFQCDSTEQCHNFVDNIYNVSKAIRTNPETNYKQETDDFPDQTEVERVVSQRRGQELLRKELLKRNQISCVLTGINDKSLLRVSHIKPWAKCSSAKERLDPDNCLLMSALWDAAFDNGLVTFDEKGYPIFADSLTAESKANLQWKHPITLSKRQLQYLKWHRENVFSSWNRSS